MSLQLIHTNRPAIQRDRLVRLPDVEGMTGLKKSTIYELMRAGKFPESVRINNRTVAWPETAVLQWVQDRINRIQLQPTPVKQSVQDRLKQVMDVHSDAEEIAAGLESGAQRDYYAKEAAAHIRSMHGAICELLEAEEGGAA